MRIKAPTHKSYLQRCFYKEAQGRLEEKKFPLAELADAASVMKKLTEDADKKTGQFSDKELTFTPSEAAVLKKVFDEVVEVPASVGSLYLEIKKLFDS